MLKDKKTEPGAETQKDTVRAKEILFIICVEELLLVLGIGFLSPILPKYIQSLGVDPGQMGLAVGAAITVFGVARAGMDIPAGRMAKRYGRRLLLVGSPALAAISAIGCALAAEYWQLIIWRLLQGASSAFFSVTALTVIGEISTPSNRGLYMSFIWGTFLIGSSLGPGLGGLMGEYLGYRAVFFCCAGLALLSTFWSYFRIPETSNRKPSSGKNELSTDPDIKTGLSPLINKDFILVCLVSFFTIFTLGGVQSTLVPLIGYYHLTLNEGQVGLSLTAIAVVQLILTPLSGRLSDKIGRKALIVSSGIIVSLGLVMFVFSNGYGLFIISAMILGLGRGIGGPVPTAYAADIAQPGSYESTMAAYRAASDLGWVAGPLLCGFLKDTAGVEVPFYLTAIMFLAVSAVFGVFAGETVNKKQFRSV